MEPAPTGKLCAAMARYPPERQTRQGVAATNGVRVRASRSTDHREPASRRLGFGPPLNVPGWRSFRDEESRD